MAVGEAELVDVWGETLLLVRLDGEDRAPANAMLIWRALRAELTDGYPVLVLDAESVTEPDYRHQVAPGELIARAEQLDLDAHFAGMQGRLGDPGQPDDDYSLDSYGIEGWGDIEAIVVVPAPEPWAVFAYLNPYGGLGMAGELLVAAARRWFERYGAEPTLVGLANGFEVAKRPAGPAEAMDLATEHVVMAGLTAGNTLHGYARSLLELDHWCLYNRP
jgi:hypothetical protein